LTYYRLKSKSTNKRTPSARDAVKFKREFFKTKFSSKSRSGSRNKAKAEKSKLTKV